MNTTDDLTDRLIPNESLAVLVGFSTFPRDEELESLPAVRRNIQDLVTTLSDPTIVGLPRARIRDYIDPGETGLLMETIAKECELVADTLIVYYAGHGLLGTGNELFLATSTSTLGMPAYNSIAAKTFRDAVLRSRAKRKLLIIDCCFSGDIVGAQAASQDIVKAELHAKGTYTMASSSRNATSLAPPDSEHTAFTGHLLDVLAHGVESTSDTLTVDELFDAVRNLATQSNHPIPERLEFQDIGRLRIARNRHNQHTVEDRVESLVTEFGSFRDKFDSFEKSLRDAAQNLADRVEVLEEHVSSGTYATTAGGSPAIERPGKSPFLRQLSLLLAVVLIFVPAVIYLFATRNANLVWAAQLALFFFIALATALIGVFAWKVHYSEQNRAGTNQPPARISTVFSAIFGGTDARLVLRASMAALLLLALTGTVLPALLDYARGASIMNS